MYEAANRRSEICIRKACARLVIRVRNIHFSVCSLPRSRKDVRERSRASDLSFVDSFRAFFAIILLLDHIMRVSLAKCTRFYHWRPQFEWRWCDRSEREREWIWIKMVPSLRPRNLLSLLVRKDRWNLPLGLKFRSVNSWYTRQHVRFELEEYNNSFGHKKIVQFRRRFRVIFPESQNMLKSPIETKWAYKALVSMP